MEIHELQQLDVYKRQSLLQVIKPSLYGDILRISSVCMF